MSSNPPGRPYPGVAEALVQLAGQGYLPGQILDAPGDAGPVPDFPPAGPPGLLPASQGTGRQPAWDGRSRQHRPPAPGPAATPPGSPRPLPGQDPRRAAAGTLPLPGPRQGPRPGPPAAPREAPTPARAARRERRGRRAAAHDSGIAAQVIHDNIVITAAGATAWFVLPDESWSFRPRAEREALITEHAARLAQLVGRRCHLRVTTRPFATREWARRLDGSVRGRHPVMPGPCRHHPYRSETGCPGCIPGHAWLDWLRDAQRQVHRWGADEKVVYLGVELGARRGGGRPGRRGAQPGLSGLSRAISEVTAAVTGRGLRGTAATAEQMRWLMVRSCWLQMPAPRIVSEHPDAMPYALPDEAPAEWSPSAIAQLTEPVTRTARPFGRTVLVTRCDGLTRHVAVLTLGEGWAGEDLAGESPWLQRTDVLPFHTEWMVTFDVRDRAEVAREMGRKALEIRNQAKHYTDHGMPMPPALERQYGAARDLEDEQQYRPEAMAGRVLVWARVAVAGDTEEEAIARAGQVAQLYSPRIPVVHPPDQLALCREFIPGERLSSPAHCRRMPATLLAAGMPSATARFGRGDGFPIGRTASLSARAVTLHPWADMEQRDRSGLIVVTGTLGSGKTTFGGLLASMAVRAGIATVIMDPSGLLDQLCEVPELAVHARAVNLLQSPAGTLNPFALIGDPRREDFEFDERGQRLDPGHAGQLWRQAMDAAKVSRRELAKDILTMLLPAQLRGTEPTVALARAASLVDAVPGASPRDVLAAMRGVGADYGVGHSGRWLADQLEELTSHPWARLFFPAAGDGAAAGDVTAGGRLLTVMTLRGLTVPGPEVPPDQYTTEQRLSVPIAHLAAWLARRHVLDRPRDQRKLTLLDEAHQMTQGAVGRAFVTLTARESRKLNHAAVLISQLPQDLQISHVANLIGMAVAGRTDGADEQAATLGFLGLPAGCGHEATLSRLSRDHPGQFIMSDGAGHTEIVQVDLGGCSAALRAALNSTPTGRPAAAPPPAGHGPGRLYIAGEAAS